MKKLFILPILSCVLLLSSCGRSNDDPFGAIYGTVTSRVTGEPIPNAALTLSPTGENRHTNASGFFEFTDLRPEPYTVAVSAVGYRSDSRHAQVRAGRRAQANFQLSPN